MLAETEPVEVLPSVADVGERSNTRCNMAYEPEGRHIVPWCDCRVF